MPRYSRDIAYTAFTQKNDLMIYSRFLLMYDNISGIFTVDIEQSTAHSNQFKNSACHKIQQLAYSGLQIRMLEVEKLDLRWLLPSIDSSWNILYLS